MIIITMLSVNMMSGDGNSDDGVEQQSPLCGILIVATIPLNQTRHIYGVG